MASSEEKDSFLSSDERKTFPLNNVLKIVGKQINIRDMTLLSYLFKGVLAPDLISKMKDGYTLLAALGKLGRIDETNFQHILHLLRILTRHDLVHLLTLRKRNPVVEQDPVEAYLEEESLKQRSQTTPNSLLQSLLQTDNTSNGNKTGRKRRHKLTADCVSKRSKCESLAQENEEVTKKKESCDIRLRVKAEYSQHGNALDGNIFSDKPELLERQFEKFAQANTILKSRDLGSIVCDIEFCELTYLDAFWRDYVNGSLLEALKGVFITESLKQAVGHESIRLLVSVDEEDYAAGRLKLLNNLKS